MPIQEITTARRLGVVGASGDLTLTLFDQRVGGKWLELIAGYSPTKKACIFVFEVTRDARGPNLLVVRITGEKNISLEHRSQSLLTCTGRRLCASL